MILVRQEIGDVLRDFRLQKGRTLRQVASKASVALGYLSEVERGQKEASMRDSRLGRRRARHADLGHHARGRRPSRRHRGHRADSRHRARRVRRRVRRRADGALIGSIPRLTQRLRVAASARTSEHRHATERVPSARRRRVRRRLRSVCSRGICLWPRSATHRPNRPSRAGFPPREVWLALCAETDVPSDRRYGVGLPRPAAAR